MACIAKTVKERPKAIAAFVKASAQGWRDHLTGNPAGANAMIKKDNPNMTDEPLACGPLKMKKTGRSPAAAQPKWALASSPTNA